MCQKDPPSPTTVHPVPPTGAMVPDGAVLPGSCPPFPNHLPEGQWTTGLYDCLDDPNNCVITALVPCITMGQIANIVDGGTISCFAAGVMYLGLAYAGCASVYGFTYRTKLRGLFSLPEGPLPDGLVHCLCACCALCQDYRELKNRGADPSIGWEGNVEKWIEEGIATVPPVVAFGMDR